MNSTGRDGAQAAFAVCMVRLPSSTNEHTIVTPTFNVHDIVFIQSLLCLKNTPTFRFDAFKRYR